METSERYTPGTDDWKKYLRATATYTDGHGSGKSASQTTVRVQDPPKVTLHLSPSSSTRTADRAQSRRVWPRHRPP